MEFSPSFFILEVLQLDLKTECLFFMPKILFPSQNSADISSTCQDSYCAAETKEKLLLKVNS